MDISAMLLEAFKLLVTGMGFVFLLLGIMVGAVNLLARLAAEPEAAAASLAPGAIPAETAMDPQLVAAISSAVHQHRQTRR
ncbi:OadG family transporter subunit [Pseudaeromonas sp. ZJS20]|uniref:OadG family transporter subunit n=1 Tax=Pseudaeromonas aegiceratis TaxID=3153928 RepID=UPI00390C9C4F